MKHAKKYSRKVLSVILAVLMITTSLSICFTSLAALDDDTLKKLSNALSSETVKNLQYTHTNSSDKVDNKTARTNKTVIELSTYAEYVEMLNVLTLLDDAIGKTNEFYNYNNYNSADNGDVRNCSNPGLVNAELTAALQGNNYMGTTFSDYNIATLFGYVFSMTNVQYYHGSNKCNSAKTQNSVPERIYDITEIKTSDYKGYLATLESRSEVTDPVSLDATLKLTMTRENYVTGGWNGFGGTNHFHNAFNSATAEAKTFTVGTSTNAEVKTKIDDYDSYLDDIFETSLKQMFTMVSNGTMNDFISNFADAKAAIIDYVGGNDTFEALWSDRLQDIADFEDKMDSATKLSDFLIYAEDYSDFADEHPDYGTYDYPNFDDVKEQMFADYETLSGYYKLLLKGSQEMIDYLEEEGKISTAYYVNFTDNVKVYSLKENADTEIDPFYEKYADNYADFTTAQQEAAYSLLTSYINDINTYSTQVQASVYPDGIAHLTALQKALECAINDYVVFFNKYSSASAADMDTAELIEAVDAIPENRSGLDAFYAEVEAQTDAETAADLLGATVEKANGLEEYLCNILAKRFENEVTAANDLYNELGRPETINLQSASKLSVAFDLLEDEIIEYLRATNRESYVDVDILAVYDGLIASVYGKYKDYLATFGLSSYEKTTIEYLSRDVYEGKDKIKTEAYDVTDENLKATIEKLDAFLASDTFTELIGGKKLSDILNGLLDKIYTDDFVNTIIKVLYPLVANEFVKVWAGLPSSIVIKDIPVKVLFAEIKVDVEAGLSLYTVEDAMKAIGLYLFPSTLAQHISDLYSVDADEYGNYKFKDVVDTLNKCETVATTVSNPWEDSLMYVGNKLDLKWGVTDEATFLEAVSVALSGLEPLLMALLSDVSMSLTNKIGTGAGTAEALGVNLSLTIDPITLTLTATGNSGYNNTVAPIIEALGLTAPDGDGYTSIKALLKDGLIDPVKALINKIAVAPVDTVLSVLPNIVYALSTNMIPSLLGMLKTDIDYVAAASYDAGVASGNLNEAMKSDKPIPINVGEMLDLSTIKIKGWPLDLTDINGLIKALGLDIPEIDTVTVATCGDLKKDMDTTRSDYIYDTSALEDGKAYTIEADKAALGYYVLTYLCDLIKTEGALAELIGTFTDKASVINTVNDVLNVLDIENTGDVIAALIELLNAEKYPQSTFAWPEYVAPEEPEEAEEGEESEEETVIDEDEFYSAYWTKEKAQYVTENLIPFVTKLAGLLGYDISSLITDLISNLYTRDNLVALVDLVNGFLNKYVSDPTVNDIIAVIEPLLTVDGQQLKVADILDGLTNYDVPEFDDGDRDAFVDALVDYIEPLVPVLKLFLLDSSKAQLAGAIDVFGYNGYDNALVPLLEAIGCKDLGITKYAEFAALDDEAMVRAVIDPILALIDSISDDPINGIIGLLPNILYFIDFGGLQMAVDNILEPVYVVLDVIRPIKNVNLVVNLNLNEIITDLLAKAGISALTYDDISSMVKTLGTVEQYTSANGSDAVYLTVEESLTPEFITILLRKAVQNFLNPAAVDAIVKYLGENTDYSEEKLEDIHNILLSLADLATDEVLFVLFYAFFGVNTGVTKLDNMTLLVSDKIEKALHEIGNVSSADLKDIVNNASDLLAKFIDAVGGKNEDGSDTQTTSIIKKIIEFFRKIWDWFSKVFMRSATA